MKEKDREFVRAAIDEAIKEVEDRLLQQFHSSKPVIALADDAGEVTLADAVIAILERFSLELAIEPGTPAKIIPAKVIPGTPDKIVAKKVVAR